METFFWQTFRKKIGNGETGWTAKKNSGYFDENPSKSKKFPHHQKWRLTNFRRSFSLSLSLSLSHTNTHTHSLIQSGFHHGGKNFTLDLPPLLRCCRNFSHFLASDFFPLSNRLDSCFLIFTLFFMF